jgi:hypothetical protein
VCVIIIHYEILYSKSDEKNILEQLQTFTKMHAQNLHRLAKKEKRIKKKWSYCTKALQGDLRSNTYWRLPRKHGIISLL